MALKDNWAAGESYTPAAVNDVAKAINNGPYDLAYIAAGPKTKRSVGTMDNWSGTSLRRPVTIKSILYRFLSADASGSTTVELRKNGAAISGTSKSVSAADQTNSPGAAREVTGLSVSLAAGDILTVHCTAVGTTPGAGLTADIEAVLA